MHSSSSAGQATSSEAKGRSKKGAGDDQAKYGQSMTGNGPVLWQQLGIPMPPVWSEHTRYDPALGSCRWRNIPPPPEESRQGKENSQALLGSVNSLGSASLPSRPAAGGGGDSSPKVWKQSSAQYAPGGSFVGSPVDAYSHQGYNAGMQGGYAQSARSPA